MTTTENGQRDELARDIFFADNAHAPKDRIQEDWEALGRSTQAGATYAYAIADGLIAKGYRKPRIITTVEELDALPIHSVIMDGTGDGIVYRKMHQAQDGVQWYEPGYVLNWDSLEITLPATILHEPK